MAVTADGTLTGDGNAPLENTTEQTGGAIPAPAEATGLLGFAQSPQGRKILLVVAAAAVIAVMISVWLWSQKVEYRVLFSNYTDRDGGAIVASLQQMNVPYKYSEGGSAILVPETMVHDARLKLASQGLPKGGNVGFELMENQKLGVSQFLEQVNFQRALEGELARSVESLAAVQSARIHLALPKASVFVRDQQSPTCSVILSLYPGRMLDAQQVSAIVHLVASSVPELSPKSVTIVDQNGNLLSDTSKKPVNGLDPTQLKYLQDLQQDIVKRVESIIAPIVGNENVRAEATADVDFSHSEQAAETYGPNQTPDSAAVRSKQNTEAQSLNQSSSGIPGALTNQPGVNATAPIVNPPVTTPPNPNGTPATPATAAPGTIATSSATGVPINTRKDATVNYEVNKTVRYIQQPMGGVKRLTVAVVVNFKRDVDANGKVTMKPLSATEKTQITDLVKEAMGFNKERGDSLNVVNTLFTGPIEPNVPLWKQPDNIQMAKEIGRYILIGAVLLYLYFGMLKPLIYKISGKEAADIKAKAAAEAAAVAAQLARERGEEEPDAIVELSEEQVEAAHERNAYADNMEKVKELAKSDPKLVASIIKAWVNNE
ncbi:flagellar basal-body MS-ring/collar protein FliF [Herbaspirillum sp. RTI4]|uniref:flagellar basal-body MS-ring/collar protein FliF n=1 Tax=Herbaspirillum sp. RTI4 TaxID=3048640 RepID=UPI002AB4BBB0|nr:flagellar basal-body MS-ring/collar protein FliF [Herbaspirillum sp. RTI4]MDY7578319.1 flagellar basal-body MS-ring/collar protein FliF [Herbaspirillum sp. RTI4]MEA9981188.1 flagellar basal-body MS-ring/collar protein FliF [Herbaspirillum sp. RTI4]